MFGTLLPLDELLAALLPEVARAANFALFCSRILAARSLISASSGLSCLTITPPSLDAVFVLLDKAATGGNAIIYVVSAISFSLNFHSFKQLISD
uniref:Secreted protein n=1 Tax=Panstrongylus lignarius TaxID=156445 RepID=A0A224XV46_9HEMI